MFAALSIDLDGLDLYHAIHGLEPPEGAANPIYEIALPRFLELFDSLGVPSTLFTVTRYLDRAPAVAPLLQAAGQGHEIASHTHAHPYNLSRYDVEGVGAELDMASERIESLFGVAPVGFRTPGYDLSVPILEALEARGYRYDSSVFPCPPYYFAKAAVMAKIRLTGSRSGSSMTDPRGLLAPLTPYRPRRGRFHRRAPADRSYNLWEIPMCVAPAVRFPIIGTTLAMIGRQGFAALFPLLRRTHPFLNLEFHGIDLLGPDDPGVSAALVAKQPDLKRPFAQKRDTFRAIFERVATRYRFVTLAQMADELDRIHAIV